MVILLSDKPHSIIIFLKLFFFRGCLMHRQYLRKPFDPIDGEKEIARVPCSSLNRRLRREWRNALLILTNFRFYYQSSNVPKSNSQNSTLKLKSLLTNLHQSILLFSVQKIEVRKITSVEEPPTNNPRKNFKK